MPNAYPELPSLPYQRTSVPMPDVISYLQDAAFPAEVKRTAYIVFRIESANGASGVNNNYAGMQADSARWPASLDRYFAGTTTAVENGTGKTRIFMAFASWQDCVACLADRLMARGLFVGGMSGPHSPLPVTSPTVLARAYTKEWVTGVPTAEPSSAAVGNFLSMYAQAADFFKPVVVPVPTPTPPVINVVAENARLRYALVDIIARAHAALDGLPLPPVAKPLTPGPDNSADDLNAAELAKVQSS